MGMHVYLLILYTNQC